MLRIGRTDFLNTFPIYYPFDVGVVELRDSIFIREVPSRLSEMDLDVNLIPVVALKDRDDYDLLGDLCIGATGEVRSVGVFSRVPFNEVKRIHLTKKSRTSRMLLRYILRKMELSPELLELEGPWSGKDAVLLIGDDALFERKKGEFPYFTDLSKLWYEIEGLPFVFAVWCVKKDHPRKNEVLLAFEKAREWGLRNLEKVSKAWGGFLGEREVLEYLKGIDYFLTEDHKKAISRFFKFLDAV